MALSENMAARCVMDHGASDGPTRGGTLQAHGNRVSQGEGSHPSGKTNEAPEVWREQRRQLDPQPSKKLK